MKLLKSIGGLIPGLLLAIGIATVAKLIEVLLPIHLIGASVLALFLGMILNQIRKPGEKIAKELKFTFKRVLKVAIILLGASLNIGIILNVGRLSPVVVTWQNGGLTYENIPQDHSAKAYEMASEIMGIDLAEYGYRYSEKEQTYYYIDEMEPPLMGGFT